VLRKNLNLKLNRIKIFLPIRREWAWRVSRGESLANLKAFEHII